jgi:aconitate hydratase
MTRARQDPSTRGSAGGVARRLIANHLLEGRMEPGHEIALRIDQTLTQDATGTLVMLELEAMGLDRVKTEVSAQYVDHNLLQTDFKNPDDHLFLQSACRRFGIWFSPPGNGISHVVHMERFGAPGKTLLGADSHSCAGGSLGMLAIGAGGLQVAMAMAGEPLRMSMPEVWGIRLTGQLPDWTSAKDVILELLRRHGVAGGRGKVLEYHGPGLDGLSAMDRHVIANMGAELGVTASVFPSDQRTREFLSARGRAADWRELTAGPNTDYDLHEEIDLAAIEPLIACPSSPGNVVPVREVAGRPIYQAYVGSSANPGLRDFQVPAAMLDGRQIAPGVSFDVNPTSRQVLENLIASGDLGRLLRAGARLHQTGCNGCIGMGQAPASGRISLRTVPRNFPGRSGTAEDQVYLVSPETATASALTGRITDPRDLGMPYPHVHEPTEPVLDAGLLQEPPADGSGVALERGPNIQPLPTLDPLPDTLEVCVLLKAGDDVSTDEILPAGTEVLPLRSNIPAISRYAFARLDPGAAERALRQRDEGFAVVAGNNYGQGSSREHAALAPRWLNVRLVLAAGFARIHWENLASFGILPLRFADPGDLDRVEPGDRLRLEGIRAALRAGRQIEIDNRTRGRRLGAVHDLSPRQIDAILAGGLINLMAHAESDPAGGA